MGRVCIQFATQAAIVASSSLLLTMYEEEEDAKGIRALHDVKHLVATINLNCRTRE
jgi:hypothetical protein